MGRSFGLRSSTVVNILASASIGIDRQPMRARDGDGMPECGKRLIQCADDFQERPLRPSHQLKHASRTKRSLGWSNDKARTGGRVGHGWLPICQLMNDFGGHGQLTHRGEIQNACARIGRSRVLSNRLVKLGQQFIREPALESCQQDFVRWVKLKPESQWWSSLLALLFVGLNEQ
jgi:hypothetical protein